MNSMEDLREEVAVRMRRVLHGQEIDTFKSDVQIPHMLGITELGERHVEENEEHTLLDPSHEFWDAWHDDDVTEYIVNEKIQTAIRSLREDETLRVTYPYGTEAEIAYVEVDEIGRNTVLDNTTDCIECGESVQSDMSVEKTGKSYAVVLSVECDCGFSGVYETNLVKR